MTTLTVDDHVEVKRGLSADYRLVLSAGRTGTVFLTHVFADAFPQLKVEHEPFPGRYELLLGNFRNDTGLARFVMRKLFLTVRQQRLRNLGDYEGLIEINPLICAVVDLLPELQRPMMVAHLVREPLSWARSITTFRASERIRPFFRWIPFSRPYPSPRPAGWGNLSELERALWRWRWCNERIEAQRPYFTSYELIRYEDLFDRNADTRDLAMQKVLRGLDLHGLSADWQTRYDSRVNAAPVAKPSSRLDGEDCVNADVVRSICGDLMNRYGYE
ncbi:MAG: hypothetical protein KDA92_12515 [Planctomycetales bacterium]|nr:hypothetical protein [Planctomycetales bacterium]